MVEGSPAVGSAACGNEQFDWKGCRHPISAVCGKRHSDYPPAAHATTCGRRHSESLATVRGTSSQADGTGEGPASASANSLNLRNSAGRPFKCTGPSDCLTSWTVQLPEAIDWGQHDPCLRRTCLAFQNALAVTATRSFRESSPGEERPGMLKAVWVLRIVALRDGRIQPHIPLHREQDPM